MKQIRKDALKDLVAFLSLAIIIVFSYVGGFIYISNYLLPSFGVDMENNISFYGFSTLLVGFCAAIVILHYLAVIVGLFFCRALFTPAVPWRIARMGPLFKVDKLLLRIIVGNETKI